MDKSLEKAVKTQERATKEIASILEKYYQADKEVSLAVANNCITEFFNHKPTKWQVFEANLNQLKKFCKKHEDGVIAIAVGLVMFGVIVLAVILSLFKK